jgi:hypothetical protein
VPVDGPTRALHLRALSLKGAVMRWSEEQPEEPARRAVLDELLAMQTEARGHATLTKPSAGLSGDGNARR